MAAFVIGSVGRTRQHHGGIDDTRQERAVRRLFASRVNGAKRVVWREFDEGRDEEDSSRSVQLPEHCKVRVKATRAGKGGKTVTEICGVALPEVEMKRLLRELKIQVRVLDRTR
uniref:SUI1 domain-containing protein n=1 Tax=Compsopogon caeruleus TaxID=31354 RepID=A0A7S1TES3_9RHOD|mmetsp:Transcript_17112/g.35615  ORF Transcript_17112/g.35615 Transcript_17112/m.35615 type:complete len:114 (+) Transcript_17112:382-723(+)